MNEVNEHEGCSNQMIRENQISIDINILRKAKRVALSRYHPDKHLKLKGLQELGEGNDNAKSLSLYEQICEIHKVVNNKYNLKDN